MQLYSEMSDWWKPLKILKKGTEMFLYSETAAKQEKQNMVFATAALRVRQNESPVVRDLN